MREPLLACLVACLLAGCSGSVAQKPGVEEPFRQFLQTHVAKVEPLSAKANLVYWEAATTGTPYIFH